MNAADIQAADEIGRMDDLALSICGSFLRCTDQGVCDYARIGRTPPLPGAVSSASAALS